MTRSRLRRPVRLLAMLSIALTQSLGVMPAHAGWTPALNGPQLYDTRSDGNVSAVADFNLDGHPDIIIAPGYETISLMRHQANSASPTLFESPQVFTSPHYQLYASTAADFNQDGRPDLAVVWTDGLARGVGIWRSTAAGFGAFRDYTVAIPDVDLNSQVLAADVNHDGLQDVIVGTTQVAILLAATPDSLQPATYETVSPTGMSHGEVAVVDATGDGVLDIVTLVYDAPGSEIWILKGDGNGSFSTHIGPIPVPDQTQYEGLIAVSDFNKDGIPDIALTTYVTTYENCDVTIFFGTGGGTFQSPTTANLGQWSYQLSAADMDKDGDMDLISLTGLEEQDSRSVAILRNYGNGTFAPVAYFGCAPVAGGVLTDVNEDGWLDIVGTSNNADLVDLALTVYLNDGAGGLIASKNALFANSSAVEIADLNGDGRPDAACAEDNLQDVVIGAGNSDGTFAPVATLPIGTTIRAITSGDLNRDGKPDLLVSGGGIRMFQGNGSGQFQPQGVAAGGLPWNSSAPPVDMNLDGKPDLITWDGSSFAIDVQDPLQDWTFTPGTPFFAGSGYTLVTVGDWNRDGMPDLALAGNSGIITITGNGTGNLTGPVATVQSGRKYTGICEGDFNRDGIPDLAAREDATGFGHRGADIFLGTGSGSFQLFQSYGLKQSKGGPIRSWDANHDGFPDLIASSTSTITGNAANNSFLDVLLGNGSGQFGLRTTYGLGTLYDNNVLSKTFAFGDFNGDGSIDVMAGRAGLLECLLATPPSYGTGIQGGALYATLSNPTSTAVGDVNRDGIPDVVVSSPSANPGVAVSLGGANGTLGPSVPLPQSSNAGHVALADMNRDGKLDVVSSSTALSRVSIMLGLGDGTFAAPLNRIINAGNDFEIADMDRDGIPDLVTSTTDSVCVYRGTGGGTIVPFPSAQVAITPVYDLDVADVNRDGYLDVVCASGNVQVLYGGPGGSLSAPVTLPGFLTNCRTICVGDANRDGYTDIVANDGTTYYVFRGAPFAPLSTFAVTPLAFAATDLQLGAAAGNGQLYVYALRGAQQLELLSVSISGALTDVGSSVAIANPVSLALGDMNRDGVIDAVSVGQPGSSIAVNLHGLAVATGVETAPPAALAVPALQQNYPNPFNPETTIRYSLPGADRVRLDVYDVAGRWVARLQDGNVGQGLHQAKWDGRTRLGTQAGSGVYYYRLTTSSGYSESKPMILLK
jgi:VCBS repeat protein/flagellar hook capping protein FlgD